ncbi:MAG TPA: aminotransferase class I/II-fold pyridoxal phosphate-dependent enzyme [Candidatus Polarisedimenticolaceae bacterium]|nr:aminotransferase class I/II-fold pyridoxal phosphate-dependent enzyme [Candidatus Polarisedimenticolaceae bacterium]
MADDPLHIDTRLIHAGEPRPRLEGAVVLPIFQSSTFEMGDLEEGPGYHQVRYIRLNNTPTHLALHGKLASLEGTEAALVTASGMSAISTTLLTVLAPGQHLLAQNCLYGATHEFIHHDLAALGIASDFVPGDDPAAWKAKLRPTTRAIYVETMSNPLLEVPDLEAVVAFAREHGLVSLIDNTFASPINFRPCEHGFDLALHSCTKYLNGHNDLVAGAVLGSRELVERVRLRLNHLGGALDPHACWLLHRGIKTLGVRVRQQNANALALARALAEHPAVARVNYPGLPAHPGHARARALFEGFGGMLSFEPRSGLAATRSFLRAVRVPLVAPSLGGVETLVVLPAQTSHAGMTPEERRAVGVTDSLVRVSVGIEAAADLIADFRQALDSI